jgi:PsbP
LKETFLVIFPIASIIVAFSIAIGFEHNELGSLIYAQSTNNLTTLLPPELESVEPNASGVNTTAIDDSTGYIQYEDSDTGFKMDYPSDWRVIDTDLTNYAVVAFTSPDGSVEVDVKLLPRQNSESLKTFGNALKNDPSTTISAYYRNSTTLLGGQPAIRVLGTMIGAPNLLTGEQSTTNKILSMTSLLKEKKSFLELIYYADRSNFNNYLPHVEHMIKSFQFQDAKPIIQED